MKKPDDYIFDLLDALRSPILTHAAAWSDCIPERLLKIIPLARLKSLMLHEEMASYAECTAFIMTRSMEAPMDSSWTDIYTHVSCQVCEEYFREDHWEAVKAPRELTDYQKNYELNPLRRHIYEKRRKILKERLKSEEKEQKLNGKDVIREKTVKEAEEILSQAGLQLKLF